MSGSSTKGDHQELFDQTCSMSDIGLELGDSFIVMVQSAQERATKRLDYARAQVNYYCHSEFTNRDCQKLTKILERDDLSAEQLKQFLYHYDPRVRRSGPFTEYRWCVANSPIPRPEWIRAGYDVCTLVQVVCQLQVPEKQKPLPGVALVVEWADEIVAAEELQLAEEWRQRRRTMLGI